MITFNCFACKRNFHAERFNIARVNIACPVCATELNIAQSLGRAYNRLVGEQVGKLMAALERVLDKSRSGDLSQTISEVYSRITQLCEEAA